MRDIRVMRLCALKKKKQGHTTEACLAAPTVGDGPRTIGATDMSLQCIRRSENAFGDRLAMLQVSFRSAMHHPSVVHKT